MSDNTELVAEHREPAEPERRFKLLPFAPEFFVSLMTMTGSRRQFAGARYQFTANQLPDDARVMGVNFDHSRRAFMVCIESAEFANVPVGAEIPVLWDTPLLTCFAPDSDQEGSTINVG